MNKASVLESEIDWDRDLLLDQEDSYKAMLRALKRTKGFSLLFVRCSPVQADEIIKRVREDLPQKKIEVLELEDEIENLYDKVANLPNHQDLNILFIRGLERSILRYEERESIGLTSPSQSAVYGGKWAGVPRILGHLNLSRERFRDDFSFCFVFLLPEFVLRYFIRRAPDFFDWRSNIYEFPTDPETVNQQAYRLVYLDGNNLETYRTWTEQQRQDRLIEIRTYLSESLHPIMASELWHEKGLIHSQGREYEEAITSYNKALEFKPDYHLAWHNRGNALDDLGRYEEAITSYNKALEFKPDDHLAWHNRGYALDKLGRYEEAITSYNKALEFKPDDHLIWNGRGAALGNLGRYEEAITSFDKALQIKPDDHLAWYNRGIALRKLGRYEEAITSFDKALEFQPDDHLAWHNRGIALRNLGRYEEAITSYNKALEIKPDDHLAWYNKSGVYALQGKIDLALESLEQAIKLNNQYREMAKTDPDFDNIRNDPHFQTLI